MNYLHSCIMLNKILSSIVVSKELRCDLHAGIQIFKILIICKLLITPDKSIKFPKGMTRRV